MLVKVENRKEHQQTADHREDEELQGGIDPFLATPDANDEIHRDQHRLVEEVEENQIESEEGTDHAGLEQQDGDMEFFDTVVDRWPGTQKHEWHREAG